MSGMDALVAWLRGCYDREEQRLAEVERVALAATAGPWEAENAYHLERGCRCGSCYEDEPYAKAIHDLDGQAEDCSPFLKAADAEHIALHDPARELAEVKRRRRDIAGKRRVLDDYDILVGAIRRVDDVDGNRLLYARREARESDIRWLAQEFDGEPGWREEWRA